MKNDFVDQCYEKFEKIIIERNLIKDIDELLILYSFGKDCTMMLDLFLRFYETHKLTIPYSVYSVTFPKHMYLAPDGSLNPDIEKTVNYWKDRGIEIKIETPPYADFEDEDKYGCRICKKSRKPLLDPYINAFPDKTGVLTGFTMYDALAYLTMVQLACNYNIENLYKLPEPTRSTTSKMLHKMSLREDLPNGKHFIRPMLPFNEKEVQQYIAAVGLPHSTAECKISKYKFKRQLSRGLDLFDDFAVTYEGIEEFLKKFGVSLNDGGLPFEDVQHDNFFIDC